MGRRNGAATRFHDLRHTSVSALIAAGVPVPEVAAIAGHATPAVTNQLYAHAVRRARGSALGEAAAFHRAQLDALEAPEGPDALAEPEVSDDPTPGAVDDGAAAVPARDDAGGAVWKGGADGAADGAAERAEAAERPAPQGA